MDKTRVLEFLNAVCGQDIERELNKFFRLGSGVIATTDGFSMHIARDYPISDNMIGETLMGHAKDNLSRLLEKPVVFSFPIDANRLLNSLQYFTTENNMIAPVTLIFRENVLEIIGKIPFGDYENSMNAVAFIMGTYGRDYEKWEPKIEPEEKKKKGGKYFKTSEYVE